MTNEQLLEIKELINQETVNFLKSNFEILTGIEDEEGCYKYFVENKKILEGVTGTNEIIKQIEQIDDDKVTDVSMIIDKFKENFREDISFWANIDTKMYNKLEDELNKQNNKIADKKKKLEKIIKLLNECSEEVNKTSEIEDENLEKLNKLLLEYNFDEIEKKHEINIEDVNGSEEINDENSTDIVNDSIDDVNEAEESINELNEDIIEEIQEINNNYENELLFEEDSNYLIDEIRERLDDVTFELKKVEEELVKFDKNKNACSKSKMETSMRENITAPRNEEAHRKEDKGQIQYVYRDRVVCLKKAIVDWYYVYKLKKQTEKFNLIYDKVQTIYRKFDSNACDIVIDGKECNKITELVDGMANNWNEGIDLLKEDQNNIERLIKTNTDVNSIEYKRIKDNFEVVKQGFSDSFKNKNRLLADQLRGEKLDLEKLQEYENDLDIFLFNFIYGTYPEYKKIAWKEFSHAQNPSEFVKSYIFPLFKQKNMVSVKKSMQKHGIRTMGEKNLFIRYILDKKIYEEDSEKVRNKVISIQDAIKSAYVDNDNSHMIPLYKLFMELITLASLLEEKYDYYYEIENNNHIKIDNLDKLYIVAEKIFIKSNNRCGYDIDVKTIKNNLFPAFRAWLCWNMESRQEEINEFFDWYFEVSKFMKGFNNGDLNDNIINCKYGEYVNSCHKEYYPISKLEFDCLLCQRFIKIIAPEKLEEYEKKIQIYYLSQLDEKIDNCKYLAEEKCEGVKEVIPYNKFYFIDAIESIEELDVKLFSQYEIENTLPIVWDNIEFFVFKNINTEFDITEENIYTLQQINKYLCDIKNSAVEICNRENNDEFVFKKYCQIINEKYNDVKDKLKHIISTSIIEKNNKIKQCDCPKYDSTALEKTNNKLTKLIKVKKALENNIDKVISKKEYAKSLLVMIEQYFGTNALNYFECESDIFLKGYDTLIEYFNVQLKEANRRIVQKSILLGGIVAIVLAIVIIIISVS